VRILAGKLPQISLNLAHKTYDVLLGAKDGFFRQAKIYPEGVQTVLDLRSRYGEPKLSLGEPMKYYDPAFYELAMRR
jgi:hypothetical protein